MLVDPTHKTPKPDWYKPDQASDLETNLLPEWFDGSAAHRTPQTYLKIRSLLMNLSESIAPRYVTATMVRRTVPGDAGSLLRLHHFLTTYSLINEDALNDSAPIPIALQEEKIPRKWDHVLNESLVEATVRESKRAKILDWEAVAATVGNNKTPAECQEQFLTMPTVGSSSTIPDAPTTSQGVLQTLVEHTDPRVLHAATQAALQVTDDVTQVQAAVAVGAVAAKSQEKEEMLFQAVAHVVDVRMQKLENRMALLDDVEGLLEAERVALELERRDLYTARCRHWFQGA
jgi:SWI/SNF related-matrix-associated actin-dependent regulator of chromatin subfamily C